MFIDCTYTVAHAAEDDSSSSNSSSSSDDAADSDIFITSSTSHWESEMSSVADLQLRTVTAVTTASSGNVTDTVIDVTAMTNASEPTSEAPTSANNLTDRHHRIGIDAFYALFRQKQQTFDDKGDATSSWQLCL